MINKGPVHPFGRSCAPAVLVPEGSCRYDDEIIVLQGHIDCVLRWHHRVFATLIVLISISACKTHPRQP